MQTCYTMSRWASAKSFWIEVTDWIDFGLIVLKRVLKALKGVIFLCFPCSVILDWLHTSGWNIGGLLLWGFQFWILRPYTYVIQESNPGTIGPVDRECCFITVKSIHDWDWGCKGTPGCLSFQQMFVCPSTINWQIPKLTSWRNVDCFRSITDRIYIHIWSV